jgi:beta-galactosidase
LTVRPWASAVRGLAFGCDYNPEQWPDEVLDEDVRLMAEAGVNLVTVGVFAWALIERSEGHYTFEWLDRVLDTLGAAGIRVDLATGTASPPPWFSHAHPETLPVTRDGTTLWPGARQAFCPSSPRYRAAAVQLANAFAERYARHSALAMWHVHNEYGCHNAHCYCETSAAAFRAWLERRYGSIGALNDAWGTTFWSQHYGDWTDINPPRTAPSFVNPTQQLDWWRFSSSELLDCYRAERDAIRRHDPATPITTNFIVPRFKPVDYWRWAGDLDLVATDHYLRAEEPDSQVDLAMAADLSRSLGGGAPWLLMEQAVSAVNWQARNQAKAPGQMRRNSYQHIARGADGVLFFQWRASKAGAEKFHSALVPHAGTDTRIWRETVALGRKLASLAEIKGSRVEARAAIAWDWEAWWGVELDAHPTVDVAYLDLIRGWYQALWRLGITVDLVQPGSDLSTYRAVFAPSLYLVRDADAANLDRFVRAGGTLLVGFFSGIVDERDHVRLGGYPGAFRETLGISVEEFYPLPDHGTVELDDGSNASIWTERVHAAPGTEVVASYATGPVAGGPAITRRDRAWYVSTRLAPGDLRRLAARVCAGAGVTPTVPRPAIDAAEGLEAVRRTGDGGSWLFIANHGDRAASIAASGLELLTRTAVDGELRVEAGGVAVVRESARDD